MRQTGYLTLIGIALVTAILAGVIGSRMRERERRHDFPDAKWTYLGTAGAAKSDGMRFYFDSASIEVSGNQRIFWLLGERSGSTQFPFALMAWRLSVDCSTSTFIIMETLDADEYGRYSTTSSGAEVSPISLLPQTNVHAAQQAVCHRDG